MIKPIVFIVLLTVLQSCQVYQSPERKEFESDSPKFRVQSLQKITCSETSLAKQATASKLVAENGSERVYEYIIQEESVFESENLQGEFCVFSYQPE